MLPIFFVLLCLVLTDAQRDGGGSSGGCRQCYTGSNCDTYRDSCTDCNWCNSARHGYCELSVQTDCRSEPRCRCTDGWSGRNCTQRPDPGPHCGKCYSGPTCSIYRDSCTDYTRCNEAGHGRCVLRDPEDCTSGTKCICMDGYTGQYCTNPPFKPCNRCYSGPSCNIYRDSCTGYNHCNSSGHGRCVLSDPTNCMSKPTCVCTDGYTGPYCTEAPCKSCFSGPTCGTYRDSCTGYKHCSNSGHGHCMLRDPNNCTSGAMCMCNDGYTGTYCTERPCKACYFGPTCSTYQDGCTEYTHCSVAGHGYCVLRDSDDCTSAPTCKCTDGYTGKYCTDPPCDRCYSGPSCSTYRDSCTGYNHCNTAGHGRCVLSDPTNCTSPAMCLCSEGYMGSFCTEPPCDRCFSGPTCDTYIDSCTDYNHCSAAGHGRCALRNPTDCTSEPICQCTDGYTGKYCNHPPCKQCYHGPTCSIYQDSCTGYTHCSESGHGYCALRNSDDCTSEPKCICTDGYTGQYCSVPPEAYEPPPRTPPPTSRPTQPEQPCNPCYTGPSCEQYRDSCTGCTDCSRAGHGICTLRDPDDCESGKKCKCTDGYRGRNCNYPPGSRLRRYVKYDENPLI